ncbi:hypothetical protein PBI_KEZIACHARLES14_50 [Mycobacterium phage Keziacharles14]|nr:hypothetical protein PBI_KEZIACHARLES14_50 [Mycobacterium phage Keziacharles14]
MSYEDPFDAAPTQAPQDEAQQAPVAAQPAPAPTNVVNTAAPVSVAPTGDLSVTFKGDGSYGAAWIVPKYTSVDHALVDLGVNPEEVAKLGQGAKWFALFTRAKQMNDHYASLGGGAPAAAPAQSGGGQRQAAPAAAQAAPNGEEKFCQHGKMEYKSGTSKKTGKPYALFSCTAPRDQQCDAQWPSK